MINLCGTCRKDVETCDAHDGEYQMDSKMNVFRCDKYEMSDEEAKKVILSDPHGNILKRMEAIVVARSVLGEDCTMEEIWKWAEE